VIAVRVTEQDSGVAQADGSAITVDDRLS